jgi:hypothetical protein
MLIHKKARSFVNCSWVLVTVATFTETVLFLLTVLKYCHWILEIKHSHYKLHILFTCLIMICFYFSLPLNECKSIMFAP